MAVRCDHTRQLYLPWHNALAEWHQARWQQLVCVCLLQGAGCHKSRLSCAIQVEIGQQLTCPHLTLVKMSCQQLKQLQGLGLKSLTPCMLLHVVKRPQQERSQPACTCQQLTGLCSYRHHSILPCNKSMAQLVGLHVYTQTPSLPRYQNPCLSCQLTSCTA